MTHEQVLTKSFEHNHRIIRIGGCEGSVTVTTAEEIKLLCRSQQGDLDAFADLQASLEPAMRRFAARLLGRLDNVDDVVQDSMIALYLNLSRIHPPEQLRAYVFRIVRNRCYDDLRRLKKRGLPLSLDDTGEDGLDQPLGELLVADGCGPEDVTCWMLLAMEVNAAIDRLPEVQRQALILYAEEKLAYEEIAAVMGCSIGTVKSRLFYAKKALRQMLPAATLEAIEGE
jgi:RNA polymerase sigma-70 factor, ECF subfamily